MMATAEKRSKPAFLVTVDTEGDNLWARTQTITTENARFLDRFQELCERQNIRPTYLTNWEMATCPTYQEFARNVLARDKGEIGMHLHAWNSPPLVPLTQNDNLHHPYLIEYSEPTIREKVKVLTDTLEETFGVKMVSHRAGRFSFNEVYARILVEHGYLADGSVTPNVSWKSYLGDPDGEGGTDFSRFPEQAYLVDLDDISRPGNSPLLEIPVTVTAPHFPRFATAIGSALRFNRLGRKVANRLVPELAWLYPKGKNHRTLPLLLKAVLNRKRDHAEFMIHSSELMPGGSPNFPTERSIEKLYEAMESLFELAGRQFLPMTMSEYQQRFMRSQSVACVVHSWV
jgi:hypothetical protein